MFQYHIYIAFIIIPSSPAARDGSNLLNYNHILQTNIVIEKQWCGKLNLIPSINHPVHQRVALLYQRIFVQDVNILFHSPSQNRYT